jgi:hypothetical protein
MFENTLNFPSVFMVAMVTCYIIGQIFPFNIFLQLYKIYIHHNHNTFQMAFLIDRGYNNNYSNQMIQVNSLDDTLQFKIILCR